ncbi:MAG TPA: hypothetical protein VIU40_12710, partial [Geobacteraceae bacterium]
QELAASLGITAYEMRQRMIGGGPAVVASFADPHQARTLAAKLNQSGVATLIIDADAVRSKAGRFVVRRFELNEWALHIEASDGQSAEIAYGDVDLLLPGTRVVGQSETVTVTERKFSLGRTILSGGIPMSKKVERQEVVTNEEREHILYLYAGERPPAVFSQSAMVYDGLGTAMKLSRELNFAYLTSELRRLCPAAGYDDRLLNRLGQVRLLGPAQRPETHLDLAFEILARSLRRGRHAD